MDGLITVNGHSHAYNKTENTNFAVLVSKTFTEPFKEPISTAAILPAWPTCWAAVFVQSLGDLVSGHRSTKEGWPNA